MKNLLSLEPVIDNTFKIRSTREIPKLSGPTDEEQLRALIAQNPAHFQALIALATLLNRQGRLEESCQLHLDGCTLVTELFDDEDQSEIILDWENPYTAAALTIVYQSATDHFIIGDFELAAAMLEFLLDHDPEDHLNASELLAFCYIALEEWELYAETVAMLAPGTLSTQLMEYWAMFRLEQNADTLREHMRQELPALYREWTADSHEIDEEYLKEIESSRPSKEAEARHLWLRTEHLWQLFPDFVSALK